MKKVFVVLVALVVVGAVALAGCTTSQSNIEGNDDFVGYWYSNSFTDNTTGKTANMFLMVNDDGTGNISWYNNNEEFSSESFTYTVVEKNKIYKIIYDSNKSNEIYLIQKDSDELSFETELSLKRVNANYISELIEKEESNTKTLPGIYIMSGNWSTMIDGVSNSLVINSDGTGHFSLYSSNYNEDMKTDDGDYIKSMKIEGGFTQINDYSFLFTGERSAITTYGGKVYTSTEPDFHLRLERIKPGELQVIEIGGEGYIIMTRQ